jgi:hypothetical protein
VYADAAAAAAARTSGQARAWELQEACRQEQLSGLLLLVAPGPQDVSRVWGMGQCAGAHCIERTAAGRCRMCW